MTTVLICDDQRAVRDGLARCVASVPGVARVDTAASGEEVLARWPVERQDLVLMDVQMPGMGGVEATRRLTREHPEVTVVMLSGATDREAVAAAIAGGARGFLQKEVSREEVCATVANALTISSLGMGINGDGVQAPRRSGDAPDLTQRELQVLTGMAGGKSNAQIGRDLFLSEDTIKTHARRLFRKLDVGDRAEAVAAGFRHGLVS
ncbi:MAG TPA: response regulator transcription factor [Mycobacteriales bacterium]|nr:response regulator transcription factor [Mycobacteriales bacterium]